VIVLQYIQELLPTLLQWEQLQVQEVALPQQVIIDMHMGAAVVDQRVMAATQVITVVSAEEEPVVTELPQQVVQVVPEDSFMLQLVVVVEPTVEAVVAVEVAAAIQVLDMDPVVLVVAEPGVALIIIT
jgi:hypothetical protein